MGGEDVRQLAVAAARTQKRAQSGQGGGVAGQFLQVGEQCFESAGASLDDFTHARDLEAQSQTSITIGKQVQVAPAQSEQLGELLGLLVEASQDGHRVAIVGLVVDDAPVDTTREGLVSVDRDLARTRAQGLAVLLGQGQPTGIHEKIHRLPQVGLGLAGK